MQQCPKCQTTDIVKTHAGFNNTGSEYWYCRRCKDEVTPTAAANAKPNDLDDQWNLALLGFTMDEAEIISSYRHNHGMTMIKAIECVPNPYASLYTAPGNQWHDFENARNGAVNRLLNDPAWKGVFTLVTSSANSIITLPVDQMNKVLGPWP